MPPTLIFNLPNLLLPYKKSNGSMRTAPDSQGALLDQSWAYGFMTQYLIEVNSL
jgi:hypothetical protein